MKYKLLDHMHAHKKVIICITNEKDGLQTALNRADTNNDSKNIIEPTGTNTIFTSDLEIGRWLFQAQVGQLTH